jgi:hypothetical protein
LIAPTIVLTAGHVSEGQAMLLDVLSLFDAFALADGLTDRAHMLRYSNRSIPLLELAVCSASKTRLLASSIL